MQRALLQFARPANAPIVRKALRKAGREDLIGTGRDCLVRPEPPKRFDKPNNNKKPNNRQKRNTQRKGKKK